MVGPKAKRQILLVDGDVYAVKNLIHVLEEHGFDTLTATSAQGTIQKAESLDIDMILLGEHLPEQGSLGVCQRLKSSRKTEHIPVILIAAHSETDMRIKGYHLGADDCVGRECEKEELFARMEAIWRRGNGTFKGLREERQRKVVQELTRIIDEGLIQPHFQPIYFLKPFRLFGLEVLSRPMEGTFITNAEELFKSAIKYDLYYPLETLCWQKAVDIVSSKTRNEHLFFNCSPYIVENSKFPFVKSIFEKSQIPFNKVVLEITERSSITEYGLFYERLNQYREQGFSFAVDDVGGGYASLESIVATKPEIVKIDAHIVRNLHQDSVKRSIIKFIVAFCKENEIISIAEGVETKEEFDAVTSLEVDAVQGYYLFRPTHELNLHAMRDLCVSFV
ncbi:MAG: EAL domain-containing protein [Candidatus Omnitrophica bacterium]|nr:EAL domain-containing protein [Candidatus Omnitrophota bacterium]